MFYLSSSRNCFSASRRGLFHVVCVLLSSESWSHLQFHLILSDLETRTQDKEKSSQDMSEEAELWGALLERPKAAASPALDWRTDWEGKHGAERQWEVPLEDGQEARSPPEGDVGKLIGPQGTYTGGESHLCCACGKQHGSQGSCFAVHRLAHTGEKTPSKCGRCGRSFGRSSHLVCHQRIPTRERPYKCPEYGKGFSDPSNLTAHQRGHTGQKPYKCGECWKSFSQSSSLTMHQRVHTGEKPHKCRECGKRFTNSLHFSAHRQTRGQKTLPVPRVREKVQQEFHAHQPSEDPHRRETPCMSRVWEEFQ